MLWQCGHACVVWIIGQHPFLKAEVRRKLVAVEILPLPVALRSAHRAERNRRAAYKINAVILLGTGWTLAEVSEALLLDDETLRSYVEKYRTDGLSTLLQTHYAGRRPHLDDGSVTEKLHL